MRARHACERPCKRTTLHARHAPICPPCARTSCTQGRAVRHRGDGRTRVRVSVRACVQACMRACVHRGRTSCCICCPMQSCRWAATALPPPSAHMLTRHARAQVRDVLRPSARGRLHGDQGAHHRWVRLCCWRSAASSALPHLLHAVVRLPPAMHGPASARARAQAHACSETRTADGKRVEVKSAVPRSQAPVAQFAQQNQGVVSGKVFVGGTVSAACDVVGGLWGGWRGSVDDANSFFPDIPGQSSTGRLGQARP